MALTSFPFENQDTTETEFSRMFREIMDDGMAGDHGDTAFAVTADGSGMDVQVAPGFAFVRGHAVQSTASITLTLGAAGTLPRIDRVVLRLDPAANSIVVAVLAGTPSSNPERPPLTITDTGIYELLLADVSVPANLLNIANSNVTDRRRYAGQRTGVWTNGSRPEPGFTKKGKLGFNRESLQWEFFDGADWKNLVPPAKKTIRVPHTFTISGEVRLANGDDFYVPPFFIPVPSGQTVKISSVVHTTRTGGVRYRLELNGTNIFGASGSHVAGTTMGVVDMGAGYTVPSNNSRLSLIVMDLDSPKNLTVTVYLDYTV